MCGVRRPVHLEGPEQSLGYTGMCGFTRSEGVPGARSATGCVRECRVCSPAVVEPADGWIQPRKITNELRKIIEGDNSRCIKVRRAARELGGNQGGEAKTNGGIFTNATIREEVDKLTLRGTLRSFIDTSSVEDSRCVDEDWHAMCQAHLQGCRGRGLE